MKELKDLKEGDYVFLHSRYRSGLRKIQKITPKGFIKVDGSLYNLNGNLRTSSIWNTEYIEALPEKEIQYYLNQAECRALKEKIVSKLNGNFNIDQLKQIYKMLGGKDDGR